MSIPAANKAKSALQNGGAKVPTTMTGQKSTGVKDILEMYQVQIAQALPKHVSPERLMQVCTTVISTNPKILACTTSSIVGAVMNSSILGFDPTPHLGQCYFVPYKNKQGQLELQFQIGYRGLITLVKRTGEVATIFAYTVHENDEFDYQLGLEPNVFHKPANDERGKLTHVYAVIKYKDGSIDFEVMDKNQVYHIKAKSQSARSSYSPWSTDEPEMWRKTALKRLLKRQPLQVEDYRKSLTDEAVIRPDDFDTTAKEADITKITMDYSENEAIEDVEFEEAPKQTEQPKEEQPQEKPQTQNAAVQIKSIVDSWHKDFKSNFVGQHGFESLDEMLESLNDEASTNDLLSLVRLADKDAKTQTNLGL